MSGGKKKKWSLTCVRIVFLHTDAIDQIRLDEPLNSHDRGGEV